MIAKRKDLKTNNDKRASRPSWSFALIGIGFVAVVSIVGMLLCGKSAPPDDANGKTVHKRAAKINFVKSATIGQKESNKASVAKPIDSRKLPHPAYKQPTNPNLPPKKYIPTIEEVENARLGPDGKPRTMSVYKSAAEQAMGMIFSTKLGSPPPRLPNIPKCTSKEQLEEFLNRTFVYDKDASKELNENLIMMQQVRDELAQYLNEGGEIGGFINFYVNELNACHEQWKTAQQMLIDMARSGEDAETLRQFRDSANKLLADKGIKALQVPPSVRSLMGEE